MDGGGQVLTAMLAVIAGRVVEAEDGAQGLASAIRRISRSAR